MLDANDELLVLTVVVSEVMVPANDAE